MIPNVDKGCCLAVTSLLLSKAVELAFPDMEQNWKIMLAAQEIQTRNQYNVVVV